ncbi:hypothetical protein [Phocaeicola sp.]
MNELGMYGITLGKSHNNAISLLKRNSQKFNDIFEDGIKIIQFIPNGLFVLDMMAIDAYFDFKDNILFQIRVICKTPAGNGLNVICNRLEKECSSFLKKSDHSAFYFCDYELSIIEGNSPSETVLYITKYSTDAPMNEKIYRIIKIAIMAIAIIIAYLYVLNGRYATTPNGYGIIDKWTKTIEVVKEKR